MRRHERIKAFENIYYYLFNKKYLKGEPEQQLDENYVKTLTLGVYTYYDELVEEINKYLTNWTLDRMSLTDQAILLLATYEIKYEKLDKKIVINEALEISKIYSDDDSRGMINACLDKVYNE